MNDVTIYSMPDIEKAGAYIAKSGLFGVKSPEQAVALMLVAQAEGRNPFEAARDYHIIQNRPALKADAVLTRFQQAGGSVEWQEYTDTKVVGKFTHPKGGYVVVDWTLDRAKQAGLLGKDSWKNYPRAMLRARCISEGVRTVFPGVASGIYTVEEVQDMGATPPEPEMEVIIPEQAKPAEGQETTISKSDEELIAEGKELVINKAVSKERQGELWAQSGKDMAAYIALLKAEPEVLF
jgi:hypothetical protein